MKRIQHLLLFVIMLTLLVGVASATESVSNTTSHTTPADKVYENTPIITQADSVKEINTNEEMQIEESEYKLEDGKKTKNINKKSLNNKDIKEEASTVSSWEQLDSIIKIYANATENTTITLLNGNYNCNNNIRWNNSHVILTIDGNGQTINGNTAQLFRIEKGSSLILKNIIMTNFNYAYDGGVLWNMGNLTLINSTLKNNRAANGGAIWNYENLTVINSTLKNNTATNEGGAIYNCNNRYHFNIINSNFISNNAPRGSAIYTGGFLNSTNNKYADNHGVNETINLNNWWNGKFNNNTYENTDILLDEIRLNIKNYKKTYNYGEDIILSYNIRPTHTNCYPDFNDGIKDITVYINGKKNITTRFEDTSLSNLEMGEYTVYFTSCNQQSNNVTFNVIHNAEVNVSNYEQLVQAIGNATHKEYTTLTINLLGGSYKATQKITWTNSATRKITIKGNGNILDGQNMYQIIDIAEGHELNLENITLTNYNAQNGGAVTNNGILTLKNSILQNNNATEMGGAIRNNRGIVNITQSTLNNNHAKGGGAIDNNNGTLNIIQSTLNNNQAETNSGGAIRNYRGTMIIRTTTLENNTSLGHGGAIYVNDGNVQITLSSLNKNKAEWYGGAIFSHKDYTDVNIRINNNNFTENWASTAGAICCDNEGITSTITGNTFTGNTAKNNETLFTKGTKTLLNNNYYSTDINLKTMNIRFKDEQKIYQIGEEVIVNFTIELEHQDYYDNNILEKINKTLYINDKNNVTTQDKNTTLTNLKTGLYNLYFTSCNKQSPTTSIIVRTESGITTPRESYEYYSGVNNKIPLTVTDPTGLKGTITVTVKDQNEYIKLFNNYNIGETYNLSSERIAEELENLNKNSANSYVINVTYSHDYVIPSSTEFTLNMIKQKNTTITYNIINNTEKNVKINITVLDSVYNKPIGQSSIEITGDINQNTTTGIISDKTLTQGNHRINIQYKGNTQYHASSTTINFNIEIDKDKKIEELTNNLIETTERLDNATKNIKNLEKQLTELTRQVNELTETVNKLYKTIEARDATIKELTTKTDTKVTMNKVNTTTYSSTVTITGTLTDKNGKTLNNMPVSVKVNTATSKLVTDSRGVYTYTGTANKVGTNNVTVTFTSNDKYNTNSTKTTFKVNKATPTLKINSIPNIKYKDKVTVTGSLMDANNKAINSANITLKINTKSLTVKTGKDGVFTYTTTATSIGTNNVTATYTGNTNYNKASKSATFKVNKQNLILTVDRIASGLKYKDQLVVGGRLVDNNGKAVANTQVSINLTGKTVNTKTDKNGYYKLTTRATTMGTNNVTVTYAGNTYYNKASAKTTFTVDKQDVIIGFDVVNYSNGKVTIQGTFTDRNRHALMNSLARITLNGKTATAKTNTNGTFTYTTKANKGTYKVTLSYLGNARYNAYNKTSIVNTA